MDDHDARKVLRSVRNEHVVLERLYTWLCIHHVLDHTVTLKTLSLHNGSSEAHNVTLYLYLELRIHDLLVSRVEHTAAERKIVTAVKYPAFISHLYFHIENSTGLHHAILRNSRSNSHLTVSRLIHLHLERVLSHSCRTNSNSRQDSESLKECLHNCYWLLCCYICVIPADKVMTKYIKMKTGHHLSMTAGLLC